MYIKNNRHTSRTRSPNGALLATVGERARALRRSCSLRVDETPRGRIAGHGPRNTTQRSDRSTLDRMRAALNAFEDLMFTALGDNKARTRRPAPL